MFLYTVNVYCSYDYRKEINYSNVLGTHGKLVNAYTLLMKQLWLQTTSKTLNPSAFYRQLTKFAPQFGGGGQHDAQEVLAVLLDGIHEDLNRVKDRPYIQDKDCDGTNDQGDAILAWQNYLLRNRSIVVDLFQGQLRNTMTCRNNNRRTTTRTAAGAKQQGCGHQNIKFEPFMYLSLPISTNCITLQDCLDLYCSTEHLTGENQWYCPSCRMHVDATKKLDLWMLPPILIIHLKRFDQRGKKIETPIFYPTENWDLSAAVKSKSGLPPKFDLYAVSNHSGNLNGGHYTALCRNRFDNYWYEMNDSTTKRVACVGNNKPDTCNPKAYCLFYNRVEERSQTTPDTHNHLKVRRQSVDRPELWPHMQLTTDFASFRRSTLVTDMPPPPPPALDKMSTIHEA